MRDDRFSHDDFRTLTAGRRDNRTAGPTYLRVVVTSACTMRCAYCHHEGERSAHDRGRGLPANELIELVAVGVACGVRKVKLLGGEPLVRSDLPQVIAGIRRRVGPEVDLSLITAGAVPPERLAACLDAGLTRANVSIHGFGWEAFARSGGTGIKAAWRQANIDLLLARGLPVKLNYVWSDGRDAADLGGLLEWAASRPVVVNVLDDLDDPTADHRTLERVVVGLRGAPQEEWLDRDPDSLDTRHLHWSDGLVVELKHQKLGEVAPWQACAACPVRSRCREGIHAVRLDTSGVLRTCMDRRDVGRDLRTPLAAAGRVAVREAWRSFLKEVLA